MRIREVIRQLYYSKNEERLLHFSFGSIYYFLLWDLRLALQKQYTCSIQKLNTLTSIIQFTSFFLSLYDRPTQYKHYGPYVPAVLTIF